MEENQTKLLFGVDLKGRRRRQIACVMSLAWLFERQTNGNIGWQCTVVKSQVSCALPSLKSGSKGAKKWMLVLVVQRWHTLLVDWQQGRHATKNFISVCHQSRVVRSCKCCFEELGSAKVAKHWKSKKICGMSIWCTGTTNRLVNFPFPNSTKSKVTWVALELGLLGKGLDSFQLENDCINWCLWMVCHPAKILICQILDNPIKQHPTSHFSNVSPDARLIVAKLGLFRSFQVSHVM